jgi:two-component system NtrC family sensor kinase
MPPDDDARPQAGRLQPTFHSLGVRLFVWLSAIMLVGFAAYALVSVRAAERDWRDLVSQGALRGSEIIRGSTRHAMLLNRKEEVTEIIRAIGALPGVRGVRIYDKQGTIIVSADSVGAGTRVDMRAEACVICHEEESPLKSVRAESRVRVYRGADGRRVLGLITPIENEPACLACHVHRADQTILGVLDVKMSLEEADRRLDASRRQFVGAMLLVALCVGAASAVFIHRVVRVPVGRLTEGARRIAAGDLDSRVDVASRDEIGALADDFNRMTENLRLARREIAEWSATLEQKVVEKTDELGRAQRQLVQMEKMASLGKLAAMVAHELNNPIAGILTYAKLVERGLRDPDPPAERREEISRYLGVIQKESSRCGDVVRNMLLFARRTTARSAPEHVNPIVARSLMLVGHAMRMAGIRAESRPLDGDDRIVCDADHLEQALVALLVNAVEAMPDGGTLSVRAGHATADGAPAVRIEVSDTGVGIAPEILPHIYEPFFTTKEATSGVGLGLAVVYGIVEEHRGRIEVESEPNKGTTFRIVLPRGDPDGVNDVVGAAARPPHEKGGETS